MKHPEKPQFVLKVFPDIFKALIKMIRKNAEQRIDEDKDENGKDEGH